MPSPPLLRRIEAALAARQYPQAFQQAQALFEHPDRSVRSQALSLGARAAIELGNHAAGLQMLQLAIRLNPRLGPAWETTGHILLQAGNAAAAEQTWRSGVQNAPEHVPCWTALADLIEQRGALRQAANVLQQAYLRHPTRADLAERFITLLMDAAAIRLASQALAQVLTRFPQHPKLRILSARAHYENGDVPAAMRDLAVALATDPKHSIARALQAQYRLHSGDIEGALEDASIILASNPSDPNGRMIQARVALYRRQPAEALEKLNQILERAAHLHPDLRGDAWTRKGAALDALGRHADALEAYQTGQASLATSPLARAAKPEEYRQTVHQKQVELATDAPMFDHAAHWPVEVAPSWPMATAPPVFVFGFPRSGTTLVENILGAHPRLVATDERNILDAALKHHTTELSARPLHALSEAELVALRAQYALRAREFDPSGRRVVDKVPLNFIHAAFIRRVFPDAPILMVLRDPRDCVWSSFVQVFVPNSAMVQTTTLEGSARLYADTMEVWRRARNLPGLRYTEVRYEDVVSDVATASRALVDQVGEPWHDQVMAYRQQAAHQTVRTPSYSAVSRPVSTRRIGRWRNHAAAMASILPLLEPFIEFWDYPSSERLLAKTPE